MKSRGVSACFGAVFIAMLFAIRLFENLCVINVRL